jgi:hypothetical protein
MDMNTEVIIYKICTQNMDKENPTWLSEGWVRRGQTFASPPPSVLKNKTRKKVFKESIILSSVV